MAKKDFISLSDIVKRVVNHNNLDKGLSKLNVRDAWLKVMGKNIASYTSDIKFDNGVLYVSLTSAALRQELSLGKTKIMDHINNELDKALVQKLVLR